MSTLPNANPMWLDPRSLLGDDDGMPLRPNAVSPEEALSIINRITFGFTEYEAGLVAAMGKQGYVDYHLEPLLIPDVECEVMLFGRGATAGLYPALNMTELQLATYIDTNQGSDPRTQLQRARIARAINSRRQLFERVVEFWTDHFNININVSGTTQVLKVIDDRDVIRRNALTSFPQLLTASANSPAMMLYLNNNTNRSGAPNENYARELMELHTLGVNGGYTQADVQNVARCFTGWQFITSSTNPERLKFTFNAGQHDTAAKTVLGVTIPARSGMSGYQDGLDVLNILANHPSCASFISTKMLRHFWNEQPTPSLVNQIANVYTSTGGDIRSMLRAIFLDLPTNTGRPKFKRPLHLTASICRALGVQMQSPANLQSPISSAGQQPFEWAPPNGYPDAFGYWANLQLARWNIGAALLNAELGNSATRTGVYVDTSVFLRGARTAPAIVDRLNSALYNGLMNQTERSRLLSYLTAGTLDNNRIRDAIGLAVSAPAFQWY